MRVDGDLSPSPRRDAHDVVAPPVHALEPAIGAPAGIPLLRQDDRVGELVADQRLHAVHEVGQQHLGAWHTRRDGPVALVDDLDPHRGEHREHRAERQRLADAEDLEA